MDITEQEMANTFNAAVGWTQAFESNAGKFLAVAQTALTVISEYSRQQEKIAELKRMREEILQQQNDVENKTRQLEATEKRAEEILNVIKAEIPGFNHIYNSFYAAVFPNGFTGERELSSLSPDERKKFYDLSKAIKAVLAVIKQEIN
jgi:hypothetical protein